MLELQNICYQVSTPEGTQDILKHVSIVIPDHKLMVFTGPTFVRYWQHRSFESFSSPAASRSRSWTVMPLKRGGC